MRDLSRNHWEAGPHRKETSITQKTAAAITAASFIPGVMAIFFLASISNTCRNGHYYTDSTTGL